MPPGIRFFVAPEEQRDWLLRLMKEQGLWCVLRRPRKASCRQITEEEVAALEWTGNDAAEIGLFLGDPEVALPLIDPSDWPATNGLDMAKSQAVELMPSLLTSDMRLLQGDLSMLGKGGLLYHGVDGTPTLALYGKLRKSLSKLWEENSVVMWTVAKGAKAPSGIHISRGALELYRQGWGLCPAHGLPDLMEVWDREAVKKGKLPSHL